MRLKKEMILPVIMKALEEDVGKGDITSRLVFKKNFKVMANIVVNEECVIAGVDIARWIFKAVDKNIVFTSLCKDGDKVKKNKKIIFLKGSVRNILASERTVLNFLGRLSGIATLTNKFVKKIKDTDTKIYDTRKTTPGLRILEKYAVKVGGGYNHRMGLWDGILIKDNHLDSLKLKVQGSKLLTIKEAVRMVKEKGYRDFGIEVNNLREFMQALKAGVHVIMLDNMKINDIKKTVKIRNSKRCAPGPEPILEVSGGITLENVFGIARAGIDRISVGALTHSAPSIDFSLEIC